MPPPADVLILGGAGFVGSHVVDRLREEGRRVRVLDKRPERFRGELEGVEYVYGDFGNQGLVRRALEGVRDVVHLAWSTVPKSSNDDPAFDLQSNVVDSVRLLQRCVEVGVRRVVFLSSGGTVYGDTTQERLHEDDPTRPICSYGISKLATEHYLASFRHAHGLDYRVLRCANAYGERQDPFGEQGAVAVFLGCLASDRPFEIWGETGGVRDYLHVSDLAASVALALEHEGPPRIFNVGSGRGRSLLEMVEVMERVSGRSGRVVHRGRRVVDVDRNVLDVSRAAEHLGWAPRVSLEDGIARTWRWALEVCERERAAAGSDDG